MTSKKKLVIEYIKADKLKPWDRNPKMHNVEAIVNSVERFDITQPVLVQKKTNRIIAGHGRLKAFQKLGIKDIPVIYLDMDDKAAKAYTLIDNQLTIQGGWDDSLLKEIITELRLEAPEIKLEELGFEDMLEEMNAASLSASEDEFEPPAEPKNERGIKLGDVFLCGKHRVMAGDATKAEDVARLMDGKKAALLHADPPYGMGKENEGVENDNLYHEKLDNFQMAWWKACRPNIEDNAGAYIWGNAEDLWRLWYRKLADSENMVLRNELIWFKEGAQGMGSDTLRSYPPISERCLFFMLGEQGFNNNADNYWGGWEPIRLYLEGERKKMKWDIPTMKRIAGHSDLSRDHWTGKSQWNFPTKEVYEAFQKAAKNDAFKREYDDLKREYDDLKKEFYSTRAYFDNAHENMTDVWSFKRVLGEERFGHATPKPVDMMARVMKSSLPMGGLCLEPFGGSGSTLIGAENTGRVCNTIEISPEWVNVILDRWEKLTKKKAKKINFRKS